MNENFLRNVFFDVKKNLSLKGYIFALFIYIICGFLPYNILPHFFPDEKNNIQYLILFCMIFSWGCLLKEKYFLTRKKVIKFIVNNVVLLGILAYIGNIISTKIFQYRYHIYFSDFLDIFFPYHVIFLFFPDRMIDVFLFFVIVSGILALIGKENISFIEGIKIFKNSIGKLFTLGFIWIFCNASVKLVVYIDEIVYIYTNSLDKIFAVSVTTQGIFLAYVSYLGVVFILTIFKNYLKEEKSLKEAEKNNVAVAFEKTINSLKGKKLKFYGTIMGIYLLTGAGIYAVYFFIMKIFLRHYSNGVVASLTITIFFIIMAGVLPQILIIKNCFKFMNIFTEKINFKKFMKIYGVIMIGSLIQSALIMCIIKFMNFIYFKDNKMIVFVEVQILIIFVFCLGFIIQSFQIIYIIKNQNKFISGSLKTALEFFSLKFLPFIFGVSILINHAVMNVNKIKDLSYYSMEKILHACKFFPNDIMMIFIIFVFVQAMSLFFVNYFIEKEKIEN